MTEDEMSTRQNIRVRSASGDQPDPMLTSNAEGDISRNRTVIGIDPLHVA
jgi:hypothetical protein